MTIFTGLIVAALLYWIYRKFKTKPAIELAPSEPSAIELAQQSLDKTVSTCRSDHGAAFDALLWLAGSDGTISRNEFRAVAAFCEQHGTTLNKDWAKALDLLNSGVHLSASATSPDLTPLQSRPLAYRAAFYGVVVGIIAQGKSSNNAKRQLTAHALALLDNAGH